MKVILERFMKLVLSLLGEGKLPLPSGSYIEFDNTKFTKILFGGDQLTSTRIHGLQALLSI